MNKKSIISLGRLLGIDENKMEVTGDWLRFSCPFAPWLHQRGTDLNPSFAVSIIEGGKSRFNCFACAKKGTLMHLVTSLCGYAGDDAFDYRSLLSLVAFEEENVTFTQTEKPKENEIVSFPEKWLETYPTAYDHENCIPYLEGRGISTEVSKALDLRWDYRYLRICFPIRDFHGRLVGMQGRDITGKSKAKYMHYAHPSIQKEGGGGIYNMQVLLGEHLINFDETVVLCEGPFDYAKIFGVYKNTLCSMGCNLSRAKLQRLGYGVDFTLVYDGDKGGEIARSQIHSSLKGKKITDIILPDGVDPGGMSLEAIQLMLDEHIKFSPF